MEGHIQEIIDLVRQGDDVSLHVAIGPIVWEATANWGRRWYFVIVSANGAEARFDQIGSEERSLIEKTRASLFIRLVTKARIVIHDCDDELEMARLCETLWPSAKTRKIRANIEAERAGLEP